MSHEREELWVVTLMVKAAPLSVCCLPKLVVQRRREECRVKIKYQEFRICTLIFSGEDDRVFVDNCKGEICQLGESLLSNLNCCSCGRSPVRL
jgi:hypothetical protein